MIQRERIDLGNERSEENGEQFMNVNNENRSREFNDYNIHRRHGSTNYTCKNTYMYASASYTQAQRHKT